MTLEERIQRLPDNLREHVRSVFLKDSVLADCVVAENELEMVEKLVAGVCPACSASCEHETTI
jgi:hypothetical protein